jgi:CheY-like chemotaxis protein
MRKLNYVLIVDDNHVDNWLASRILELNHICSNILSVANGKDALKRLEEFFSEKGILPELILIDLQMPLMDGFQLIGEINKLPFYSKEKSRILILTAGIDDKEDVERIKKLGVKHILYKPLDIKKIFRIIK